MSIIHHPSSVPHNQTVWALVKTKDNITFWMLANNDAGDWIGLHQCDEHPSDNTFDEYGWDVIGWKELVAPELPEGV